MNDELNNTYMFLDEFKTIQQWGVLHMYELISNKTY